MAAPTTVYSYNYSAAYYTLSLYPNANGGGTVPATVVASATSSDEYVTVTATVPYDEPTRSGYRFLGYAATSDGAVQYHPGDSISHTFTRSVAYDHTNTKTVGGVTYVTYYYTSYDQSAGRSLYAIWEASASTVSASDGTLGAQQTISITANSQSYTHTLRYSFAGQTGTIATGVSSSYNWTPPLTLAQAIPSAGSGSCVIECDTYNSGTLLGTSSVTITLSVPATVKCTIASVALAETVSGINAKFSGFVQNKSKVSVTGTFNSGNGSPAYGATVSGISISINGQTLNTNGAVTNLLTTSGTNSYTFTITDTRGRTDTYSGTFTVLAYTAPSVSVVAERNSSDNTQIDISYSWVISACSNLNDKAIAIVYTPSGGTATTVNITPSAYTGNGTYTLTSTDPNDGYSVVVTATDFFGSVIASSAVSASGNRIFRVSKTDKRMIFFNGIQLGATVLTEAQLIDLLSGGNVTIQQDANTGGLSIS